MPFIRFYFCFPLSNQFKCIGARNNVNPNKYKKSSIFLKENVCLAPTTVLHLHERNDEEIAEFNAVKKASELYFFQASGWKKNLMEKQKSKSRSKQTHPTPFILHMKLEFSNVCCSYCISNIHSV